VSDDIWKRDEIDSPCVSVCVVHPDAGICIGCYRRPAEIARWSVMTPEERRQVLDDLPGRTSLLRNRRRGRAARIARRG
jgi:predicted Fe-S protein YdhL (DUF1289 family)